MVVSFLLLPARESAVAEGRSDKEVESFVSLQEVRLCGAGGLVSPAQVLNPFPDFSRFFAFRLEACSYFNTPECGFKLAAECKPVCVLARVYRHFKPLAHNCQARAAADSFSVPLQ